MAYQMDLSVSPSADARLRAKARQVFYKMKGSTHFSREELYAVLFIYFKLTQRGPMDKELFEDAIARIFKITDSETLDRIFMLIETPSHRVGPVGWARLLSTFCRGTLDEKVDFVFQVP
ncbi:hypothetical protein AAG570_005910 [Ranatra chinensis]|uniref:Uncharacterized protein n=1 Tax=Ranatra chinensis TaxID=642074 RepID=A0ABD0XYA1_9HEMI